MARGDHLRINRGGYEHHGIDIGDGTVVHFAPTSVDGYKFQICRQEIEKFLGNDNADVVYYPDGTAFHPDQTCVISLAQIGESNYKLLRNNCEHLAQYCKTGKKGSKQIQRLAEGIWKYSRFGLLHPGHFLTGPLVELTKRSAQHVIYRLQKFRATGEDPAHISWFTRPLFRRGESYGATDRITHFREISGKWFEVDENNILTREIDAPPDEIQMHCRWWVDDNGLEYMETTQGWFTQNGNGKWLAFRPEGRRKTEPEGVQPTPWLSMAPLGAINALIDVPSTLQELVDAMEELTYRQWGDTITYQLLLRYASADTSMLEGQYKSDYDYIRQAAFWTLGILNRNQNRDMPTTQLPGIEAMARIISDEGQPADVRIAAVQSLQTLERSTDITVRQILSLSLQSSSQGLRQIGRRALDGERISLDV